MVKDTLQRMSPARVLRSRPVRDYFWMTLGILITAFALDAFLIPNRIAAGGVSGLATVIFYTLKDAGLPTVPVGVTMLVFNLLLLAIGVRSRGWRYGAKTIYGAVGLSVAIDLMAPFIHAMASGDKLLAVLWGGALCGLGMGMVFRVGGNTGGTDIVAQLLTKKISLGVGQLMLLVDACVLLVAALKFGPELALYGAVAVFVTTTTIDVVQEGLSTEKAAFIFSRMNEQIAAAVLTELGRGVTAFAARGMYTG
ncbi:MAG TPA: YitT family protein, partial [Coriobacteriia bacterium]